MKKPPVVNLFNEQFKGKHKFATQVRKTYDEVLHGLTLEARRGNKQAAENLLIKMAEQNIVLYHLGFRVTDKNKLVKL